MFKINRKIEYALMALSHMSQKLPGELTSAREVSDCYKVPFDGTARVMQKLAQTGWLRSEQGPHGGYQIITDLARVSFLELAEMILGPVNVANCLHEDDSPCEFTENCNILSPMARFNKELKEFYKALSIKDLILDQQGGAHQNTKTVTQHFVV